MIALGHQRERVGIDLRALARNPVVHVGLGLGVAWLMARPDLLPLVVLAGAFTAILAATYRWPIPSLIAVVVSLPFIQLVQSWLWMHDLVPVAWAIRVAYVKEIVLLVALLRALPHRPRPLPIADLVGLCLVALFVVYTILPYGPTLRIRYVGARGAIGWILLFLTVRWTPLRPTIAKAAGAIIPISAAVVAALGVWNRLRPAGWAEWVADRGVLLFRTQVLDAPSLRAVERVNFGDGQVIRAGSLFFTPNDLAYFLLVVVAIVGGRVLRRVNRPWEPFCAALCLLCIFYTFSRSAMAMVGVVGLMLALASGRLARGAGAIVVTVIGLAVLVGGVGAGDQIRSGVDSNDERTAGHIAALENGVERIITRPLGSGVGTSSATAIRFGVQNSVQTENFYLRVGVEAGVLATIGSISFVVLVLRALLRRARREGGPPVEAFAALAGVAGGALVLETFSELATSWTLWLMVGLALPASADAFVEGNRRRRRSRRRANA